MLLLEKSGAILNDLKDTHKKNTPSKKTEALTKSMNICIYSVGILNQLFIRDSIKLKLNFQKK